MKSKTIIRAMIIILIIQTIIPIKVMALGQKTEIVLDEQGTETGTAEKSIFDSNITYSWEFIHAEDQGYLYNYVLLTPSNASDFSSLPVIVWLHSADATVQNEGASIAADGLPRILLNKNKGLDRFSAYIVCPQITNKQGQWNPDSMEVFLNKFKKDYNVDTDNIIITGHSLGGNSAVMLAAWLPDYFSKAVIFSSSYVAYISIPTIWYVGKYEDTVDPNTGEINYSYTSAARRYDALKPIEDVHWVESGHAATYAAYELDDGNFVGIANNNRSDLVEWMFEGYEPKLKMSLDNTSLTLPSQQIKQLNVISSGNMEDESITWTSSDETVAEVDANGLITALKEGKTTITSKVGTTELTCQVTVSGQLGDVDKDGSITAFDAYKALKASVDSLIGTEIDEQIKLTSDVNKNQKLESEDAYEILKYSVGLINKF